MEKSSIITYEALEDLRERALEAALQDANAGAAPCPELWDPAPEFAEIYMEVYRRATRN